LFPPVVFSTVASAFPPHGAVGVEELILTRSSVALILPIWRFLPAQV
jgi:hypothetical protein